jgi:hypothetical protein
MLSGRSNTSIILYTLYRHDNEYEMSGAYLESLKDELLRKG